VAGLPDSLAVLRRRDFRLLFGAQAVSVIGDRIVAVALAFAVLELGGSASEVGIVLAARMLPMVGCLLVGGVAADRLSRRTVMVAADLVRVVSQGALAATVITGAGGVWTVALLAGVTGAATGFFNPASTGLLPAVVPAAELQQANGLRATAMSAGEIVGPAIAGGLVASAGAGWALAIDAATFAVSAALLVRLRPPPAAQRSPTTFLADLRDGWGAFRSRTWVWSFVAFAAVGNMLWGSWSVLGPVVAARDLGGAAAWGGVLAAMGVGALLGGLAAIRTEPRRPLVVATCAFGLCAVPVALLAAAASTALVALGALVGGAGLFLGNSVWESALQRNVPAESLSRVSAYDWFGSLAFQPVGLAIWGPVAALVGVQSALWIAAIPMVATSAILVAIPDVRRLEGARRVAPSTA
jgi:MFS family permease